MEYSIPYCPRQFSGKYFHDHLYDEYTGDIHPAFSTYCDQLQCPTFNHVDAMLGYLLGWTPEQTDEGLWEIHEESMEEALIHREEDIEYRADQERWNVEPYYDRYTGEEF